ncbi:MAG: hypothetical protein KA736_01580 [Crocinitomicaceae bacterium]|nr:hypothetical protein [Crocinitomicaceae bacterium]MBP6032660.1 hypothetical protein [Crocinitomicaceae bacterium]
MTKLQIEGTHYSYSILEFKKEDALFLQSIMEKELVSYDKIFFERRDFKRLGFKKLEDLPVVAHFSGFLSEPPRFLKPSGVFTLFQNRKKVFISPTDRLEERYHTGLYKEFCELKSTIRSNDLNYRKRRGCKYFFLKKEQSGTFIARFKEVVPLNQLLFQQSNLFKVNLYFHPTKLVNVMVGDSKLDFALGKKLDLKQCIQVLK